MQDGGVQPRHVPLWQTSLFPLLWWQTDVPLCEFPEPSWSLQYTPFHSCKEPYILYYTRLSEDVRRVCRKFDIRTVFATISTLRQQLTELRMSPSKQSWCSI